MFIAQQGRCFYCARQMRIVERSKRCKKLPRDAATRDHFIPRSCGINGRVVAKIVWACHDCNAGKRNKMPTPEQARRFVDLCISIGWAPHRVACYIANSAEAA
jgi:5-methylcytosine-specific restriction endonuclease McrA